MWPPDLNVVMSYALKSTKPILSVMLTAAMMLEGSVMSRIWTPSSSFAATAA